MELNHTCLELLKILYDQQDYVTIGDLAEQLGKTERSVRYNLDTIDAFMKKKKLPFLHRKFGSGIYMEHTAEIESILQNLLSSVTPYQYKFSTAEREIYLELCLMIGRKRYPSGSELADQLTGSYGTVAAVLVLVEK